MGNGGPLDQKDPTYNESRRGVIPTQPQLKLPSDKKNWVPEFSS